MEQVRQSSAKFVSNIIHNPLYTGIGPFPRIVDDDEWVRCIAKSAEQNGPDYAYLRMAEAVEKSFGIPANPAMRSRENLKRLKKEILSKGAEPFFSSLLKDLRKSLSPLS